MPKITPTKEDYIREIHRLSSGRAPVRMIDIGRNLKLARSTVSERIKELERAKLIKSDRSRGIILTKKGNAIGKHLTYKHRLIEVFLHDTLGIPVRHVHAEAHRLEHAFSDAVINRLDAFLGHPTRDPHGKTIKKA